MMARKLFLSSIVTVIVVLSLVPSGAKTEMVDIRSRSFSPRRVTIDRGDTVRWNHRDDEDHSVTASSSSRDRGEAFDSSSNCPGGLLFDNCMNRGDKFSHTFTTSGTFTYFCKIHGADAPYPNCGMCGQVVVRGAGAPGTTSPTTSPTATATPTRSASPSPSATSPSPTASITSPGGPTARGPGDDSGNGGTIALAAAAVVVLGGSGLLVYRTMIRR